MEKIARRVAPDTRGIAVMPMDMFSDLYQPGLFVFAGLDGKNVAV